MTSIDKIMVITPLDAPSATIFWSLFMRLNYKKDFADCTEMVLSLNVAQRVRFATLRRPHEIKGLYVAYVSSKTRLLIALRSLSQSAWKCVLQQIPDNQNAKCNDYN